MMMMNARVESWHAASMHGHDCKRMERHQLGLESLNHKPVVKVSCRGHVRMFPYVVLQPPLPSTAHIHVHVSMCVAMCVLVFVLVGEH